MTALASAAATKGVDAATKQDTTPEQAAGIPAPPQEIKQPSIGQIAGGFGGRMIGSMANRGMDAFGNSIFGKWEAQNAGAAQKAMADKAFPGTNPWEQLGSGGQSAAASMANTDKNNKLALKMQARELQNKKEVATIQTNPGMEQAGISRERLPSEIEKNFAAARQNLAIALRTGVQQKIDEANAQFAVAQAQLNLIKTGTSSAGSTLITAGLFGKKLLGTGRKIKVKPITKDTFKRKPILIPWSKKWNKARDTSSNKNANPR